MHYCSPAPYEKIHRVGDESVVHEFYCKLKCGLGINAQAHPDTKLLYRWNGSTLQPFRAPAFIASFVEWRNKRHVRNTLYYRRNSQICTYFEIVHRFTRNEHLLNTNDTIFNSFVYSFVCSLCC